MLKKQQKLTKTSAHLYITVFILQNTIHKVNKVKRFYLIGFAPTINFMIADTMSYYNVGLKIVIKGIVLLEFLKAITFNGDGL